MASFPDVLSLALGSLDRLDGGFRKPKAQLEDFFRLGPKEQAKPKAQLVTPPSSDLDEDWTDAEVWSDEEDLLDFEVEISDDDEEEEEQFYTDDYDEYESIFYANKLSGFDSSFRVRAKQHYKHEKLHRKGLKHAFVHFQSDALLNFRTRRPHKEVTFSASLYEPRARRTAEPSPPANWGQPADPAAQAFEQEFQAAIRASLMTAPAPSAPLPGVGLTQQQIMDLANRDLTPEDYELLLLLDQSVAPKTADKKKVDEMPLIIVESLCGLKETSCPICMDDYEVGNVLKELPCKHYFHEDCICHWLTTAGRTCPLDGLEV